jgi:hypothetical protein
VLPDLRFGPVTNPEGGGLGDVVVSPAIPSAAGGIDIEWADMNVGPADVGTYSDVAWVTDDTHDNVTVWSSEVSVDGLAAGASVAQSASVPPATLAPGTYTFHVMINASWVAGPSVLESNTDNNESFNGGIEVRD